MPPNTLKTETEGKETSIQNALARSTIYQSLSLCFSEPDKGTFPILKDKGYLGDVQESLETFLAIDRINGAIDTASSISLLNIPPLIEDCIREKSLEDIKTEYTRRFGTFVSSKECPIYETFYGKLDIFQQTQELADISGFYRAFGLKFSEDVKKDKFDHLSVELEFMHYLTYKEAYALENHGDDRVSICVNAEKKLMKGQLGKWVGLFAVLVNKHSKEGFYALSADLLKSFIKLEWKFLNVRPDEVKVINDDVFNEEDFQCGPGTCETAPNTGSLL